MTYVHAWSKARCAVNSASSSATRALSFAVAMRASLSHCLASASTDGAFSSTGSTLPATAALIWAWRARSLSDAPLARSSSDASNALLRSSSLPSRSLSTLPRALATLRRACATHSHAAVTVQGRLWHSPAPRGDSHSSGASERGAARASSLSLHSYLSPVLSRWRREPTTRARRRARG